MAYSSWNPFLEFIESMKQSFFPNPISGHSFQIALIWRTTITLALAFTFIIRLFSLKLHFVSWQITVDPSPDLEQRFVLDPLVYPLVHWWRWISVWLLAKRDYLESVSAWLKDLSMLSLTSWIHLTPIQPFHPSNHLCGLLLAFGLLSRYINPLLVWGLTHWLYQSLKHAFRSACKVCDAGSWSVLHTMHMVCDSHIVF